MKNVKLQNWNSSVLRCCFIVETTIRGHDSHSSFQFFQRIGSNYGEGTATELALAPRWISWTVSVMG